MATSTPSPASLTITGYPSLDSLIRSALVAGSAALTTWIVSTLKLTDPNAVVWIGGAIFGGLVVAVTAAWGWFKAHYGDAIAVTAGINLATKGGVLMQGTGDGTLTPVPVTPKAAQDIIKNFGKPVTVQPEELTTAQLNISQLGVKP